MRKQHPDSVVPWKLLVSLLTAIIRPVTALTEQT